MHSMDYDLIPRDSYGILFQDKNVSELDEVAEQVRRIGYAILESGYSANELSHISDAFDLTRANYIRSLGEERLRGANELQMIRAPLTHGDPVFIKLATNKNLLKVLSKLILGKFILNQQNGIINPPREPYSQGSWHRDLPYQNFVSSSPLAVNALFCVDDFTPENGATFVLPATHKTANYPSESYILKNALQVGAKAGQFIILDCMIYHSGGMNRTNFERRGVNQVYTIPYFKQQIKLPDMMIRESLEPHHQELFGFNYQEPTSIEDYLDGKS